MVQQYVSDPHYEDQSTDKTLIRVNWHSDGTPNLGVPRALTDNVPEPN